MPYRRCGRSGLKLPAVSLGLWHNFGHDRPLDDQRAIVRRAFDLGITHFDLANNYGPPLRLGRGELRPAARDRPRALPRRADHLDARPATTCGPARTASGARASTCSPRSTRASRGWASTTSTSSTRTASTPTRRWRRRSARSTAPCARARRSTSGSPPTRHERTREAAAILRELGTPLLIHQPSYSLLNRWIEPELLDVLGDEGIGCIVFSPLGQGMLTEKYLDGVPEDSRAARGPLPDARLPHARRTSRACARSPRSRERRGQSLAQMAIAWTLRDPRVTSALIGASSVEQLEQNVAALENLELLRRRARRDRPPRRRLGHQPLGGVQRGLSAVSRRSSGRRRGRAFAPYGSRSATKPGSARTRSNHAQHVLARLEPAPRARRGRSRTPPGRRSSGARPRATRARSGARSSSSSAPAPISSRPVDRRPPGERGGSAGRRCRPSRAPARTRATGARARGRARPPGGTACPRRGTRGSRSTARSRRRTRARAPGVSRTGLSAPNASVSVSPAKMSTGTRSYSRPSRASSRRTL